MHPLGEKRIQIIVICIIIAFVSIAFVSLYSLHLLNDVNWSPEEPSSGVDVFKQQWEYELGITAPDYESRPLYTNEIYENDKLQIVKNIKNDRFDFIATKAKDILASYKFDDDKLSTITVLAKCTVFDPDNPGTSEDKISLVSSIKDPELYILFFTTLSTAEQRMLITYEEVNTLPGFRYDTISVTKKKMDRLDPLSKIIGTSEYYDVELTYYGTKFYVYLVQDGTSLQIFYINNETHDMNGFKY